MKSFDNRIAYSCLAEQNMNCHGVPLTKATSKSYKLCKPYPRLHPVADFIFFLTNNCMLEDYQSPSSEKPTNQAHKSTNQNNFICLTVSKSSSSQPL